MILAVFVFSGLLQYKIWVTFCDLLHQVDKDSNLFGCITVKHMQSIAHHF